MGLVGDGPVIAPSVAHEKKPYNPKPDETHSPPAQEVMLSRGLLEEERLY